MKADQLIARLYEDQRGGLISAEMLLVICIGAGIALIVVGNLVPAFQTLHGSARDGIGKISETGW